MFDDGHRVACCHCRVDNEAALVSMRFVVLLASGLFVNIQRMASFVNGGAVLIMRVVMFVDISVVVEDRIRRRKVVDSVPPRIFVRYTAHDTLDTGSWCGVGEYAGLVWRVVGVIWLICLSGFDSRREGRPTPRWKDRIVWHHPAYRGEIP